MKTNNAQAKARLLTVALRTAAHAGVSAQAQALLAVVIAEAWVDGTTWSARLGVELLARRLACTRHSIQRWAQELEREQLVRRRLGNAGAVTRWTLARDLEGRAGATPPVRRRNGSVAPALHARERRRSPDSDIRCETGLARPQPAGGSPSEPAGGDPRASPDPRESLPRLSRFEIDTADKSPRIRKRVRDLAAQGDPDAVRLLLKLNELVEIGTH